MWGVRWSSQAAKLVFSVGGDHPTVQQPPRQFGMERGTKKEEKVQKLRFLAENAR